MDPRSGLSLLVLTSTYPRWRDDTDPGFVHELCRRLAARGFAVDVLAPRAPGTARTEELDGVTVHRYPYFLRRLEVLAYGGGILPKLRANPALWLLLPWFVAGLYRATARRLRRGRYDIVHAHWILPQGLIACLADRKHKAAIAVTSHGGDLYGLRARPFRALKRWTLERSDRIAVVSNAMREKVLAEHAIEGSRVQVLPMGADLAARFRLDVTTNRDPDRILFVGRLVEKKGVAQLIDALVILRGLRPTLRLDVAGDGPLRRNLEMRAASLGLGAAVRFHGSLPPSAIATLLQSASVAVVPSVVDAGGDQEGLGLVTIEAMGCGCPVVASDLPAIRDVVESGRTGLLAKPGDPEDLAQKIQAVFDDPDTARTMADAARQFVAERYDWETVADAYAALFYDMVARHAPRNAKGTRS